MFNFFNLLKKQPKPLKFKYVELVQNEIEIYGFKGNKKSINGELEIPSEIDGKTVTGISDYAFYSCKGITKVTIPNTVKKIGEGAFNTCISLSVIQGAENVSFIGENAFENTKIYQNNDNYENGVLYVGKYLLSTQDVEKIIVKKGTTFIKSYAFYDNKKITEITMPNTIKEVGCLAFHFCKNLKTVNFLGSIDEWAQIKYDIIKPSNPFNNSNVKLYINNTLVTTANITNAVTINPFSFAFYNYLTTLTLSNNVKVVGYNAFRGCDKLTKVIIGDGVTDVDSEAFSYCRNLKSVTLGSGVKSVGYNAFKECSCFEFINKSPSVVIEKDCGYNVFNFNNDCCYVKSSIIANAGDNYNSIIDVDDNGFVTKLNDDGSKEIIKYYGNNSVVVVPKNVSIIGEEVFSNNQTIKRVEILGDLTKISNKAFLGCENLEEVMGLDKTAYVGSMAFKNCKSLKTVSLNETIIVGESAFENCVSLQTVEFKLLLVLEKCLFQNCTNLKTIKFNGLVEYFNSIVAKKEYWAFGVPCKSVTCDNGEALI